MDENILGLQGKVALVVGGGFGIGRSSALLLARAGADVAVVDLDGERAAAVAAEVAAYGVSSTSFTADVTDGSAAAGIVERAAALGSGLDVVINMVGLASWNDLFSIDDDEFDHQISINLRHHFYLGRAAARLMIDQGTGGAMAFVASVSGVYGAPNHAIYGAAKAGLMGLTRTMSQEWGPHGIRVNAIAPDMIATPRVAAGFEAGGADMNDVARAQGVPLGRFGVPDDIAGGLLYLVSDLSAFVTGQTIIVDGGTHAAFPHAGLTVPD